MIVDANDLSSGDVLSADVCIAGAGAAGITLALALREAGLSVIVLESGGFDEEDENQALYEGTMSGINTWQLDSRRERMFGGSTSRWAGWCRPMHPFDFEPRPYIAESGWPVAYDDLVPFYEKAHARVQLADFIWDLDEIQAISGRPLIESPGGRLRSEVYQFSPPTRFGDVYRDDLEAAEDVTVYLYANVRNLDLESNLSEIRRFECATLDGVEFDVEARAYVLAMGGLENVRLLLASNTQLPEGVANSSDAVGRYFMEHPHYNGVCTWVMGAPADISFYERHTIQLPSGPVRVQSMLSLTPEVLEEEGLLDFTASIKEAAVEPGDTGDIYVDEVRSLLRQSGEDRIYQLHVRAEQTPLADSRVTLKDNAVDALGMPRLNLNWKVAADDKRRMRRAMEIVGAELAAAGLGRLWTSTKGDELSWTIAPGGHHMGTTRMSEEPDDGVVDANCRCHDVENLYIAGSSVFRTGASPNPTLTIVALAERLAAHLQEELS